MPIKEVQIVKKNQQTKQKQTKQNKNKNKKQPKTKQTNYCHNMIKCKKILQN